jgi:hypothetical protein
MEYQNLGYCSIIYPKPGEMGGASIFNVSFENLSDEKALQIIDEIKRKNVHTWWGCTAPQKLDRYESDISCLTKERSYGQTSILHL